MLGEADPGVPALAGLMLLAVLLAEAVAGRNAFAELHRAQVGRYPSTVRKDHTNLEDT